MNDSHPKQTHILVIDDNPEIHEDYRKILTRRSDAVPLDAVAAFLGDDAVAAKRKIQDGPIIQLDSAYQGEEGLQKVKEAVAQGTPYSLAFVDMRMPPGWDGLQTIEEMWKVAPDMQVVICTAYSDDTWEEIVDRIGRSDQLLILKKPFDKTEVSQLAVALTEKWVLAQTARLKQADLERLVEERTEQLRQAALHDPLTGLPNRKLFHKRLDEAFARNRRLGNGASLILVDLDRFKQINDTMGHPTGDELLVQAAMRLTQTIRPCDTVARLGGDEFAVIWTDVENVICSGVAIQRIQELLNRPYQINGNNVHCGASMGVAVIPEDGNESSEVFRKADFALYRAKKEGRGRFCLYDDEMDSEVIRIRRLENDLVDAVNNQEFEMHYQPLIDVRTGKISTVESLIRWRHPVHGIVPPNDFIPIAERRGSIVDIGKWVIRQACDDAVKWPCGVRVSINVSAVQFRRDERLVETIDDAINVSGIDAKRVDIEITESVSLDDYPEFVETLHAMRMLGVSIVLDDFGTGHSSLSYLRRFPFDKIKLDASFVNSTGPRGEGQAIIRAVAALGKSLGMRTTAEGVETEEQYAFVVEEGYDEVQGFLFSRPVLAENLTPMFAKQFVTNSVASPNTASKPNASSQPIPQPIAPSKTPSSFFNDRPS